MAVPALLGALSHPDNVRREVEVRLRQIPVSYNIRRQDRCQVPEGGVAMSGQQETAGGSSDATPANSEDDSVAVVVQAAADAYAAGFTATVAVRNYLAVQHLWSALRAARMCDERESELVATGDVNVDLGHRADAINAVLSAVAFLEAFVNETFSDAAEPGGSKYRTDGLSAAAIDQMAQFWTGGAVPVERGMPVLRKYQLALLCARKSPLDIGCGPAQAVGVLIELRNALVHFMPKTQDVASAHKLERDLRPRITPNRQLIGAPWYPNSALAAGCARWAGETAMGIVDEWQKRMGLVYDYRTNLDHLPAP
ncbi:hypothetical protein [Nocardia cyriacigeorgica]|uniref:hypothetical protein n=1 Tax=Nocardia cyriacigeorgica TaxID=135487 RepID=UPI001893E1ED|nr:hypothetical protein [Nocardia cyriacigeorgica]MBF6479889.1 hypothetical protein [Nocardia cyriacigeorgica]